jgi:hypothetical protein
LTSQFQSIAISEQNISQLKLLSPWPWPPGVFVDDGVLPSPLLLRLRDADVNLAETPPTAAVRQCPSDSLGGWV